MVRRGDRRRTAARRGTWGGGSSSIIRPFGPLRLLSDDEVAHIHGVAVPYLADRGMRVLVSQPTVIVTSMTFDHLCPRRVATMQAAVELDVDKGEFRFENSEEAALWDELEQEFAELVARIGRVWIAD